ncbi:MAG TPA: hypothetical protein VHV76_01375 [Mycobacteriales bacterium]|jgi:hypothetical protein|nr:hypothetical protein [Mycobacteriales bacterium]
MIEPGSGPRSGSRDNGLRCAGYVAAGDLDPRVADGLLENLREEGIAAYALPTPAAQGGYLELRLPATHTDRVFVDSEKSARAMELFEQERADSAPEPTSPARASTADVDAAWQQLLTSLQTPSDTATWPSREDVGADTEPATFDAASFAAEAGSGPRDYVVNDPEDAHFVPPRPPPLPKLRAVTIGAIAAIVGGLLILISGIDGGDLYWLGILGILGGGAALVWHMKEGPPEDSGWDDGAVV